MSHCDERAALWVETTRRARVKHRCSACCETIPAGAHYRRISRGGDGSVDTVKQCARCAAIFDAIREADAYAFVDPELGCGESWLDTFGENEPDDVAALAFVLPTDEWRAAS